MKTRTGRGKSLPGEKRRKKGDENAPEFEEVDVSVTPEVEEVDVTPEVAEVDVPATNTVGVSIIDTVGVSAEQAPLSKKYDVGYQRKKRQKHVQPDDVQSKAIVSDDVVDKRIDSSSRGTSETCISTVDKTLVTDDVVEKVMAETSAGGTSEIIEPGMTTIHEKLLVDVSVGGTSEIVLPTKTSMMDIDIIGTETPQPTPGDAETTTVSGDAEKAIGSADAKIATCSGDAERATGSGDAERGTCSGDADVGNITPTE